MNQQDTRLQQEYTRYIGPNVVELTPDQVIYNQNMVPQMLNQRGPMLRNLDRQMPNIQFGDKIKTYENPVTRADFALNQLTPEAVRNSQDLRFASISQNDSRMIRQLPDTSANLLRSFQDAQLKYGNKVPLDKMVDPKIVHGFTEGAIKVPKRNDDYTRLGASVYDARNSQDNDLFTKKGNKTSDYITKHNRDPIIFVSQGMDRSNESIDSRSQLIFTRYTDSNGRGMKDPRLTSGMIGTGVVKQASAYSTVPENSRRMF